jgi:hypothetical protein
MGHGRVSDIADMRGGRGGKGGGICKKCFGGRHGTLS